MGVRSIRNMAMWRRLFSGFRDYCGVYRSGRENRARLFAKMAEIGFKNKIHLTLKCDSSALVVYSDSTSSFVRKWQELVVCTAKREVGVFAKFLLTKLVQFVC